MWIRENVKLLINGNYLVVSKENVVELEVVARLTRKEWDELEAKKPKRNELGQFVRN